MSGERATDITVGYGLAHIDELEAEVDWMWGVLVGRHDMPILPQSPHLALQEVATAYLGRALEMDTLILRGERKHKDDPNHIAKGSLLQKFRTGDLANLIVLCRRCADLGSRRLTEFQMMHDQDSRSSW